MPRRALVLLFILLACAPLGWARDIAVVANKTTPDRSISLVELVKMVKGATKKWADGRPVVIVMKDPSSAEMRIVVQKVFGMTPDEVKAIIAANKESLIVADSDDMLIRIVGGRPGALGLVDIYSITSDVEVLKVDGKLPLQFGYVLHGN
jgi:hypothetical protein